jgi:hypothetical protein
VNLIPWRREWLHESESFWSVANKIAWVLAASVREVVRGLTGAIPSFRERVLFPGRRALIQVSDMLRVNAAVEGRQMFAGVELPRLLQVRERWLLAVRFCPECIRGGVHRTYFQDLNYDTCLTHGCALCDTCPRCWRPLDPICVEPWSCNVCGTPLFCPSRDWNQAFIRGPVVDWMPTTLPWVHHKCDDNPSSHYEACVTNQLAFEAIAALTSVFLARHADCAHRELALDGTFAVGFECPLGAAAAALANQLGTPQAIKGGWPESRPRTWNAHAIWGLAEFISRARGSDRHLLTRGAVQLWFREAVISFAAAARLGKEHAVWVPSSLNDLPGFAFNAPRRDLEHLVGMAGHLCRHSASTFGIALGRRALPSKAVGCSALAT